MSFDRGYLQENVGRCPFLTAKCEIQAPYDRKSAYDPAHITLRAPHLDSPFKRRNDLVRGAPGPTDTRDHAA
jgi:hypothetical protein